MQVEELKSLMIPIALKDSIVLTIYMHDRSDNITGNDPTRTVGNQRDSKVSRA